MEWTRIGAGVIFGALSLIALGFGLAMAYECFAIITNRDASISQLTAQTISANPHVALAVTLLIGGVLGALVTHFTNWRP